MIFHIKLTTGSLTQLVFVQIKPCARFTADSQCEVTAVETGLIITT